MNTPEEKFISFIQQKAKIHGGSLHIQVLAGHLSQLDPVVRSEVGSSRADLIRFLKSYKDIFNYNNSMVTILKSANEKHENTEMQDMRPYNSEQESFPNTDCVLPSKISAGNGVIISVHATFGFIVIKDPIKASIHFTAKNFDKNITLLTDIPQVQAGKKVVFNAIRGKDNFAAKYRATEVWFPDEVKNEVLHPEGFKKSRKTRDTGLYDPLTQQGEGVLQKVFPNFGFIMIDSDPNNIVFFHKSRLMKYENVTDLGKILRVGDTVQFEALRSTKKDIKVRWEATKVWVKKKSTPVDSASTKSYQAPSKSKARKKLENIHGKVYPSGTKGTVIKFGTGFSDLADADSCQFYNLGSKVEDVGWELCEGDDVIFNAVEIRSAPGWKATLAWKGARPDVDAFGEFDEFSDEYPDNQGSLSKASSEISLGSRDSHGNSKGPWWSKSIGSASSNQSFSHKPSKDNLRNCDEESIYSNRSSKNSSHSQESHTVSASSNQGFSRKPSKDSLRNCDEESIYSNRSSKSSSHSQESHTVCNSNHKSTKSSSHELEKKKLEKYQHTENKDVLQFKKPFQYNEQYRNWGDTPYPAEYEKQQNNKGYYKNNSIKKKSRILKNNQKPFHRDTFDDVNISDEEFKEHNLDNEINSVGTSELSDDLLSGEDNEGFSEKPQAAVPEECESLSEIKEPKEIIENTSIKDNSENPTSATEEMDLVIHSSGALENGTCEEDTKAEVNIYHDLEGTVSKLFTRYGYVQCDKLKEEVPFFLKNFYRNGACYLRHFDDLNENVKVGNELNFNCFEIIDDTGTLYYKITLIWRGSKPTGVDELSPQEYILSNDLKVTLKPAMPKEIKPKEYENKNAINAVICSNKQPRKFLKLANSCNNSDAEDHEEKESNLDSFEDALENNFFEETNVDIHEASSSTRALPNSWKLITSEVCNMMRNRGLSAKTAEVDLEALSDDIVNYILNATSHTNVESSAIDEIVLVLDSETSEVEGNGKSSPSKETAESIGNQIEFRTSETQTIVTGEIFSQSIFTK